MGLKLYCTVPKCYWHKSHGSACTQVCSIVVQNECLKSVAHFGMGRNKLCNEYLTAWDILVNTGAGHGVLPNGTKSLPQAILTHYRRAPSGIHCTAIIMEYSVLQPPNCDCNPYMWNSSHMSQGLIRSSHNVSINCGCFVLLSSDRWQMWNMDLFKIGNTCHDAWVIPLYRKHYSYRYEIPCKCHFDTQCGTSQCYIIWHFSHHYIPLLVSLPKTLLLF